MTPHRPTIVVTGGAGDLGSAIVGSLVPDARVIVIDRSVARNPVEDVTYLEGDISGLDDVERLGQRVSELCDGDLFGLVHCAALGYFVPLDQARPQDWQRAVRVNVDGTIAIAQALTPLLSDGGRVVLISSGTAFKGPAHGSVYAATKAAMLGFARSLASQLGERAITVNVVAPGLFRSSMSQRLVENEPDNVATRAIKRPAVLGDFVGPVRFFLSADSAFVTGQTLVVDGGSFYH